MTIQELRRDPVGFLRQVNRGKTMTIIYRSKPFAVVTSAEEKVTQRSPKNIQRMLEFAELARKSAKTPLDPSINYKEAYQQDLTKKYDIS